MALAIRRRHRGGRASDAGRGRAPGAGDRGSHPERSRHAGDRVQNLASLADAYNKLIAASRRVMPETDRLAVAMDVLRRFAEYVSTKKPALAAEFIDMIEPFGEAL
ncbi:MAG: DUF1804 family protein, partial [Zoogloeaceae bacterium]|nr:DUF1804 family protein [Zoogloeaceae bacterium]